MYGSMKVSGKSDNFYNVVEKLVVIFSHSQRLRQLFGIRYCGGGDLMNDIMSMKIKLSIDTNSSTILSKSFHVLINDFSPILIDTWQSRT